MISCNDAPLLHTVTFDPDNGTPSVTMTVRDGEAAAEPEDRPYRAGYAFIHWKLDGEEYDFSLPVTSDLTLTARYSILPPADGTVTFTANYDGAAESSVTYPYGTLVEEPDVPSREGYHFGGWYTASGEAVTFPYRVTGDVTLYARWYEHEVGFDLNLPSEIATIPDSFYANTGDSVAGIVPDIADEYSDSYTFLRWADMSGNTVTEITGDMTLEAVWKSTWDGETAVTELADVSSSTIEIRTAAELAGLEEALASTTATDDIEIVIWNDIDLAGHEWTPIDFAKPVSAIRGRGTDDPTKIERLSINEDDASEQYGLFGYVRLLGKDNTIKDLDVAGTISVKLQGNTSSSIKVGGIFGWMYSAADLTIENCCFSGDIDVSALGYNHVGGIAGQIDSVISASSTLSVSGCSYQGEIDIKVDNADNSQKRLGGLVGSISGFISAAFSDCQIGPSGTVVLSCSLDNYSLNIGSIVGSADIEANAITEEGVTKNVNVMIGERTVDPASWNLL